MKATNAVGTPCKKKGEETRERILAAADELVLRQGYKNTGLADILLASGVPRGSFYFYFKSKRDLGRELITRYRDAFVREVVMRTVVGGGPVVPQILALFRETARIKSGEGYRGGCLLGNLAAEISEVDEELRVEVAQTLRELRDLFKGVLEQGQASGELRPDFSAEAAGEFLLAVLEGSILLFKAKREPSSFANCESMLTRYLGSLALPPVRDDRRSGGNP